jgi:hypothetical protein
MQADLLNLLKIQALLLLRVYLIIVLTNKFDIKNNIL